MRTAAFALKRFKGLFDDETKAAVRNRSWFRAVQHHINRSLHGGSLRDLAVAYGSTKWGIHEHAARYETHLGRFRSACLNLLEIGIGGYSDPIMGGASLRMWRTYFPKARIFGIDLFDKHAHDERRIRTFKGSQTDPKFLADVIEQIGRLDIIIDDGSGENADRVRTFELLFPRLDASGIYAIENTQTSYWGAVGGSSADLDRRDTVMGFLKHLVDGLNHAEFERPGYEASYYDRHIVGIHFYHNIAIIEKGSNTKPSNVLVNNERDPEPRR